MKQQSGFTLIELLVVVAIIGILSQLGLTSFYVYRADAAYANVKRAIHEVNNAASAGVLDADHLPAAVPLTTQTAPGPLTDANAQSYLLGYSLSPKMKLQVSYDPSCTSTACVSGFVQVNHCSGKKYIQFLQFGDGSTETIEDIAGAGCL